MLTPSNIVGASFGYVSERLGSAARPFQHYGEDAKRDTHAWQRHERKSLTVLVVGRAPGPRTSGYWVMDATPRLA